MSAGRKTEDRDEEIDPVVEHSSVVSLAALFRRPKLRILFLLLLCFLLSIAPDAVTLLGHPPASGNVLAEAKAQSSNTIGAIQYVLRGKSPAEGQGLRSHRLFVLGSPGGEIRLDIGREVPIRALLMRARHRDSYGVYASTDAVEWTRIWAVPPSTEGDGFRTRRHVFDEPVPVRYLRVSNEGAYGISAIGAIRAYSELPPAWPHPIDASPAPAPATFPWLSRYATDVAKFLVALTAAGLMVALFFLGHPNADDRRRDLLKRLLLLVSAVAGLCWWNLFQVNAEQYDLTYQRYWDVYHYYMGSKYSPELRYTNLYRCYAVADVEDGLGSMQKHRRVIRDLETNSYVDGARVMAEPARCKDRFTRERWASFKRDHAWFRTKLPTAAWLTIPTDHGYNASPAWAILGATLSNLASPSDLQFRLLTSVDTILFVFMWYMVWSSFGWLATCAAIVFWGTNYTAGNWFTAGAFLRHDWLFLTVAGVCCLKRQKMAGAGFLLAYAALLRVFPGFLLGGVLLKSLAEMVHQRRFVVSRQHRNLALGVAVGVALIVALSFLPSGRGTVWGEFAQNTLKHRETTKLQSMGVDVFLSQFDGSRPEVDDTASLEDSQPTHTTPVRQALGLVLAGLFLPLLFAAVSREEDWVAAILGVGWIPFVTGLTNYYYVILLVYALLIVRKKTLTLGFAGLIVVWAGMGVVYDYGDYDLFAWSSGVLFAFVAWVTILFAMPSRGTRDHV